MKRFSALIAATALFAVGACAKSESSETNDTAVVPALLSASTDYEPMKPFENFVGKTMRGEGTGPDGAAVVDIANWEYILGGRALQTTHRLENGTYGGRTIFFYDESAKKYIFHYFTTAGFHTTGEAELTDNGFKTVEQVNGHPTYAEVHSKLIVEGDVIRVISSHVDKDGKASEAEEGFVYRVIDGPGPKFD